LPKPAEGADENRAWTDAVVANVNQQVAFAVQHFGKPIREGTLTVIGSVYDLKGALGGGLGKLHILNVNGNSEPERMQAFTAAIGKPVTVAVRQVPATITSNVCSRRCARRRASKVTSRSPSTDLSTRIGYIRRRKNTAQRRCKLTRQVREELRLRCCKKS